jgi:hypothetical protein
MDGGIEVDRAIDEAMKTKKTQEVSARNPERKISNDVEGGEAVGSLPSCRVV